MSIILGSNSRGRGLNVVGGGGGGGSLNAVSLSSLSSYTTTDFPGRTTSDATTMAGLSAGGSYTESVTGVTVIRLTDSGSDAGNNCYPWYSATGLQISQPWEDTGVWYYTCAYGTEGDNTRLIDVRIDTGATSNDRAASGPSEANFCFGRAAGNERVIFYSDGNNLRKWDTATNSQDTTGNFPYSWTAVGGIAWMNGDANDEWFSGNQATSGTTAIYIGATGGGLTEGDTFTTTFGNDEPCMSPSGDLVFINTSAECRVWIPSTGSLTASPIPSGIPSASPNLVHYCAGYFPTGANSGEGYVLYQSDNGRTISSVNSFPFGPHFEDASSSYFGNHRRYYQGQHGCGYWWDYPAGTDAQYLLSQYNGEGGNAGLLYNVCYLEVVATDNSAIEAKRTLVAYHHSETGAFAGQGAYYSQPHATCAPDGGAVMYGSNMGGTGRIDAFLALIPRAA